MAFLKGKDGVVKFGTDSLAHIQNWNVDEQGDTVEGWGMGDTAATSFSTIQRWSGSLECYIDPTETTATLAIDDEVALTLLPGGEVAGLPSWTGNAAITSIASSGAKDGIPIMTISFANKGPLTKGTVSA